jgi:hypothetical protein
MLPPTAFGPEKLLWDPGCGTFCSNLAKTVCLQKDFFIFTGADHDDEIDQSMRHGRWLQIKRVVKLCNNQAAPKQGVEGYDPAYKYNMLWYVLFANVNAISKHAELDLCADKTTWGHGGFGEAGTGLVGRSLGKPRIPKGGQIVMVSNVNQIRPGAYIHRHKLHAKPPGWTTRGPSEVRKIMEMITPMIEGQEPEYGGQRQIYEQKPHSTWDNHFSGDIICNWMGENGFGCTMTCSRDRLLKISRGSTSTRRRQPPTHMQKLLVFISRSVP